jgi:hydroxymethylbilane synthase
MLPAACQGIVGITVRTEDTELLAMLSGIEDPEAKAVATAERALLGALDGSCRTPIGGYARLLEPDRLRVACGSMATESVNQPLKQKLERGEVDALASTSPSRALVDGSLYLTGLVARADGSFLLKRSLTGAVADAARMGAELGASLKADSPADIFAP